MNKNPSQVVHIIADFLGIKDVSEKLIEEIVKKTSFSNMSQDGSTNYKWRVGKMFSTEGNFFRKGIVGDWKSHFSSEQNTLFDKVYKEKMEKTGLVFDFE